MLPSAISIYPNPVIEGKVNVSFVNEAAGKYQLTIINLTGQMVHAEELKLETSNLQKRIDLSNAAAGNYQLLIQDEKGFTKKIAFVIK